MEYDGVHLSFMQRAISCIDKKLDRVMILPLSMYLVYLEN